jgi:putative transport protein
MAVGSLKVRGVGLGTAGVLFAGILTGYFGRPVDHATLEFVKEFGLILFVFTIGLQLGPGFLAALRQQGLALNALAATVVALGALTAPTLGWLLGIDPCRFYLNANSLAVFSARSAAFPAPQALMHQNPSSVSDLITTAVI